MTSKKIEKQIKELEEQQNLNNRLSSLNRARSFNIGTAFGGVTEISMRRDDGQTTYAILQPVEVVELLHQLAANVGCHVALKPRKDFASWRDWRVTEEERERLNGWFPFVNDMAPYNQLGAQGMDPEILKALDAGAMLVQTGGGNPGKGPRETKSRFNAGAPANDGQPGASSFNMEAFKRSKQNALATEKPKNRRSTKRATKAS